MEEFLVLKNRITRLEDMTLKRQEEPTYVDRLDLELTNRPTEPTEELPPIPTPPQELQRQQKFWLPPPRQYPNKIMKE
jgi:hypothetical protein